MSRRTVGIAFLVSLAAVAIGLVLAGRATKSTNRLTLGDFPTQVMASLRRGHEVCQTPLRLPAGVDRVRLVLAPGAQVRGPEVVTVKRTTGTTLAQGELSRRQLTGQPVDVRLDRAVSTGAAVEVCVTQRGREAVEVWGQAPGNQATTPSTSAATLDGKELGGDLYLEFPRARPATMLSRIPEALRNAAPFKLGGTGPWLFWILGFALVLGGPVLLVGAVRRAAADDDAA